MPIATRNNGNLAVAFDTWTLNSRFRNQGIYVYAKHLLTHLRELAMERSVEVRSFVAARTQNDANAFKAVPGFQPREAGMLRFDRLWRYGGAWMSASWQNPDVFFCPAPTTVNLRSRFKKVVTVH